jgi:hypothetical protein
MTGDKGGAAIAGRFEVAVAFAAPEDLQAVSPGAATGASEDGCIPGTTEAFGVRREQRRAQPRPTLVEKGEDVVREATEALAEQIGTTARRIADAIGRQEQASPPAGPGAFGLDSVEMAFGITLSGGVQTLFTAQAESSVQVTITLTRPQDQS